MKNLAVLGLLKMENRPEKRTRHMEETNTEIVESTTMSFKHPKKWVPPGCRDSHQYMGKGGGRTRSLQYSHTGENSSDSELLSSHQHVVYFTSIYYNLAN